MKKVCLVTGVGPGTGTQLVRRFAEDGYHVAMLSRNEERLKALEQKIDTATAYVCDVSDLPSLTSTIDTVKTQLGLPDVVIHNAVGGVFGDFLQVEAKVLEENFQVNTMALLHLSQLLAPEMIARGSGAILCTGNTSAYRGKAHFAGFAPTKAAQRILAESIARRLGPEGIHVAYVLIDAVIDVPWARKAYPDAEDDFFCKPVDIANECFRVVHQPKSSWSFNVEIRPYCENW
ncbi:SDR family oxidoreductase [Maricurvus nonylphenolicus]|uniref:SDR family NAD(P)-dependent oxidoreductase n=1 Tax=Maricurvus nonylphenolicus TaxID=1008307 RepID=UPI0036F24DE0